PAAEISRARSAARQARAEREKRDAEMRERKRARAFELWMSGAPLAGTLGEVYLNARGIDPASIPSKSSTFRFLPALDYWKGGAAAHRGPAIVGAYRDALRQRLALHATWLTADGLGKADLDPPKLSLGEYKGLFLPITRGAAAKEPWDADCPPGPCQVTEGPEDGWSVAQARPDLRTWAAGSLSNIGNLPCPACVSAFLVVRQNDWATPAAVAAFDTAIAALRRHGVPVAEIGVGVGKDPNDQLRGKA
ncbi:MAG: toprim domain-containing protein, partial [Roseiarcus sp.]